MIAKSLKGIDGKNMYLSPFAHFCCSRTQTSTFSGPSYHLSSLRHKIVKAQNESLSHPHSLHHCQCLKAERDHPFPYKSQTRFFTPLMLTSRSIEKAPNRSNGASEFFQRLANITPGRAKPLVAAGPRKLTSPSCAARAHFGVDRRLFLRQAERGGPHRVPAADKQARDPGDDRATPDLHRNVPDGGQDRRGDRAPVPDDAPAVAENRPDDPRELGRAPL